MTLLFIIVASFLIMFASLAGVFFVSKKLNRWTENNLEFLIAFASGVFLVVSYNLIIEALEFGKGVQLVLMSVILGFLAFYLFEKAYPEAHCHHGDNVCEAKNSKRGAKKVMIGDALHNIGDGLLLAPVFVIDVHLGFIAAFGIFIHEFVQEISEFFVLKSAGYTTKKALLLNFGISSSILIGALIGFHLSSFEILIGPLIGLSAGAFIYILFVDLIPQSVKNSHKEKRYIQFVVWALSGILLVVAVNTLASSYLEKQGLDGHGHLPGEHHDEEHHEEHMHNDEHEHEDGHEREEEYEHEHHEDDNKQGIPELI